MDAGEKTMTETNTPKPFVSYIRVSSKKQGKRRSNPEEIGLGLAAQRFSVEQYVGALGGTILREFIEVESGRKSDRPQLASAIGHCKRTGATLIIAKMDRLARNVHFMSGLMESKLDFVAVDNPTATRLTIHILAAVAENEAEAISARTKAGLAAAKRAGTLLGSARPGHWDGREHLRLAGLAKARVIAARMKREQAMEAIADLKDHILAMRDAGMTIGSIAKQLNCEGHLTSSGSPWLEQAVKKAIKRFENVKQSPREKVAAL